MNRWLLAALFALLCRNAVPLNHVARASDLGTIDGTVSDQRTGAPIAGAWIFFVGMPGCAISDESGHFRLTIRPGPWDIRVSAEGYGTSIVQDIRLPPGETIAADFRLFAGEHSNVSGRVGFIEGRVRDAETDRPIPDAIVEAVSSDRWTRTDDTGHYRLSGVRSGLTDIRARAIGYATVLVRDQRILSGQTHLQNFRLEAHEVRIQDQHVE